MAMPSLRIVRARYERLLRSARPAWTLLGIGAVLGALTYFLTCYSSMCDWLSAWGVTMEVVGVSMALWGLQKRPELIDETPITARVKAWCREFATSWYRPEPPPINLSGGVILSSDSSMSGWGTVGLPTLEQRLDALEARVAKDIPALYSEIGTLRQALSEHQTKTDEALRRDRETVRKVAASGVAWELVGVLLVLVGLIVSALPQVFPSACRVVLPPWFTI